MATHCGVWLKLCKEGGPQVLTWADLMLQDKPGKPLRSIEQVLQARRC